MHPSVACAASILTDALREGEGLGGDARGVVRLCTSAAADVECGASMAVALLSHLSHNAHLEPDVARVAYVARDGALAVLGYGCCVRADSLAGLDGFLPDGVVAVGGEAFEPLAGDTSQSSVAVGWLVPLLEIRSSAATWPHVHLAANIRVGGNDGGGWRAQRGRALQLLAALRWSFTYHPAMAARVPPADDPAAPPRDTGMNEQQYTAAVDAALDQMRSGTLHKVRPSLHIETLPRAPTLTLLSFPGCLRCA